jgi:isopentenyl diphosphate isomerase/L-lactate dehydrogenase-like FMN-dependent dehydrogenase
MPGDDFQALHEVIERAREKLDNNIWDFIVGGAESEMTLRRNRLALDSIAFRPRVLRDVNGIDASTGFFGRKSRLPVMLAPVGSLHSMHPGGAATSALAAAEFGIPTIVSSASEPGLEAVAKAAPDAVRIFQLYVRGDDDFVEDHVRRAIDNGYAGFCLTVDVAIYSRRERDIRNRYAPVARRTAGGADHQAGLSWRTVQLVKDKFDIPLMIKGIATAEDAVIAVEHGVEWISVSNHAGRQLDCGRGTIEMLPEIVAAVAGRAKVIVDGSFQRGTDICKALALGADAVGIGRMQCFGTAAAGQSGVVRILELLEDEVQRSLGQLGVTRCDQLDRSYLHEARPTNLPDVLSAFPLIRLPADPAPR